MKAKYSKAELTLARILDAALECYGANGIAGTSLDEVAKTAGIGRTTLYRYVDNRESLVDSIVYIMRGRRSRPINVILFGAEDRALIDRVNLSPANFYGIAEKMLEPFFFKAQEAGQVREGVTLPQMSQWVARIILSLINYPEEFLEDESALRQFLQTFLVPSVAAGTGP